MMSFQYDWKYRIYVNGRKSSTSFDDLVAPRVKVNIKRDMYYPHTGWQTPFAGIKLRQYINSPELNQFLQKLIPARGKGFNIWSEIKRCIYENWIHGKIHVIGSSSGYDSRIIAKAIKELWQKHGSGWLGETYFVECGGEKEGFTAVMDAIGIPRKMRIIWEPDYTFEYFDNLHERFNGLCAFPANQWYDYFVTNWKEEDIQYISGYGGNVSDAMRKNARFMKPLKNRMTIKQRLQLYFKWNYNYQLSAFREPRYSLHPFWTWRYIKSIAGFDHKMSKTSMYLCKHFVPECKNIRRMEIIKDVIRLGRRTVSKKVTDKLYEWYRSTDYGKRHNIKPEQLIDYNRWWLQLCIANYAQANNISIY